MQRDYRIPQRKSSPDGPYLEGKSIIIVGGTGGLGRALSHYAAKHGARVTVVGQTFRDAGQAGIDFVEADLTLMRDAARTAASLKVEHADAIVFTTGIFAAPKRQQTAEGIERDLAVSFLNRLVMLQAIAPRLGTQRTARNGKPRVFVMGFPGTGQLGNPADLNAEHDYKAMAAHMNTVAGNEALVIEASVRFPQLDVFGLNPGLVKTSIRANLFGAGSIQHRFIESLIGFFAASSAVYAARVAPLIGAPEIENQSGALFNRKAQAILPSKGMTPEYARNFIVASEALASEMVPILTTSS